MSGPRMAGILAASISVAVLVIAFLALVNPRWV
jgi:hypothetical protein